MSATTRRIDRADILSNADFDAIRKQRKPALIALKKHRRVQVGPHATFYFENYETMWWQIQEMLRIEKGGETQIGDELAAYNPLVPQGSELVATLMFEVDDPVQRAAFLNSLGGVEETVTISVAGETIRAVPETEVERTTEAGKTSALHFLHFPFSAAQISAFRDPAKPALLGIGHANYGHIAVLAGAVRAALALDFA